MIGTAAALLGSAAIGAGASIFGANKAAKSAREAAALQQQGIETGINQSQPYYEQGQNFLAPYVKQGQQTGNLLNDIIGLNGPDAQARALGMYKSSPSANLLENARAEAIRSGQGQFASRGLLRSGALTEDLARRTSDLDLTDYYKWQGLGENTFNTGANAASRASGLAIDRGDTILGARTGQGTAAASGTIGAANANIAGLGGANNWLQYAAGRIGQGNDWWKNGATGGTAGDL